MLVSRTISQVQIGGNGADNPSPFGDFSFDFDAAQALLRYRNINVIAYHNNQHAYLQVTGKVHVDASGAALTGPNDVVYLPCPPYCNGSD